MSVLFYSFLLDDITLSLLTPTVDWTTCTVDCCIMYLHLRILTPFNDFYCVVVTISNAMIPG